MAGRIYISPVTYTETLIDGEIHKENVVLIRTLAGVTRVRSAVGTEPTGANRGRSAHGWSLCYVEASDWSAVEANNQVRLIRLEEDVDAEMPNIVRNRIQQAGALTAQEMPTGMTFKQAMEEMLFKHYGHRRIWDEWPEIFSPPGE